MKNILIAVTVCFFLLLAITIAVGQSGLVGSSFSFVYNATCEAPTAGKVIICGTKAGVLVSQDGGPFVAWPAQGQDGLPGTPASISVNNVVSLPPGSSPTITNVGNGSNAVLDFGIPQGLTGAMGPNWTSCDVIISNFKIPSTTTRTGTMTVTNCH